VVKKWYWDRIFSEYFGFSLSTLFHQYSIHAAVTRRTNGRSLGTSKRIGLSEIGEHSFLTSKPPLVRVTQEFNAHAQSV
jgi:hypothetical protein